jgi:hypothetical protein
MKHDYRATVFIKFSTTDEAMKKFGMDSVEMPASGFLHDDLLQLLDGEDGVCVVESVVVKECQPLPTPLEFKVVQTICQGCNQLKETQKTPDGVLCTDCFGEVVPITKRKEIK